MEKLLEEFGLTKTEAKIYLLLLRLGSVPASEIIKKAQLHRTTVYDVLERLIEKGLIAYIVKNDKKHFEAASPTKFLNKAEEEKARAEEKKKLAEQLISSLQKISEPSAEKTKIKIYSGKEGLKTIMDDIILGGEDFAGFGGSLRFVDMLPVYTRLWSEKRIKKNIRARLIGSRGTKAPVWKLNENRAVPESFFSPASTLIYGNKIAIILEEEPILILQIESGKIAGGYKKYFGLLWRMAEKFECQKLAL